MKKNRSLFIASLLGAGVLSLSLGSCSKSDDDNGGQTGISDTLRGDITASRTLTTGKTYYLSGPTFVMNSAILTIQPGVVIKAIKGTKAVLVITKGCKIDAQGTATQPIVFTSNQPVAAGSNGRVAGDWGGVVLMGKAKVNTTYLSQAGRRLLEGFDQAELPLYGDRIIGGGDDDADNSGIMKYVRIEFPGIPLSSNSNSELNGLTFVAVGSTTVIDYIQVAFSGDDSFEWFGGTVNAKHLIAYKGVDDDFDTDNGYRGKVQFGLSIRDNSSYDISAGASNGFESDNEDPVPTTLSTPLTAPVFSNMTLVGPGAFVGTANVNANFGRAALLRRGSQISIYNSVFLGWANGVNIDGANSGEFAVNGQMEFKNNIVAGFPAGKYIYNSSNGAFDGAAALSLVANNNDVSITDITNLKFTSLTATAIDARPATGSPLLGKASFAAAKLAGLTTVTYAGALNTGDTWMDGWVELDPKNKVY
jgi:hypothetical protein